MQSFDENQRSYKWIVVGSGAGGAPAALELVREHGGDVAMLEAGRHLKLGDFNQVESSMFPRLYQQGGAQATEDGSISVLQGRVVGGSTVVNDALAFRPPPEIHKRWQAYGFSVDSDQLEETADEVEARMGVVEIPRSQINRANYLVGLGAARLGWRGERLRHNSPGCVQCGFRSLGCSYDAKRSMNLSYIPEFMELGGHLHTQTAVHHLQWRNGGWEVFTNRGTFRADSVVMAAGIVQTPSILLRSGMTEIGVGTGLQFHVQTAVWGDFPDAVDGHNGIPMAYGVLEFADIYGQTGPGYLIEGVAYQPMAIAAQTQMQGEEHEAFLRQYRNLSGAVMLLRSSSRGSVTLQDGEHPRIQYRLDGNDLQRTGDFYQKASEMYFAADARAVWLPLRSRGRVTRPIAAAPAVQGQGAMYTAHPFGGANYGTSLEPDGSVKGTRNLWVVDASSFPEALGVNPQITIASLATITGRRIAQS